MLQVMSLPYLLQSLVPAKGAICVPIQPRATVHHYPSHCKSKDRSSTDSSERTGCEYATKEDASYVVPHNLQKNNTAGYGARQCAANTDVVCARPCMVKSEEKGYKIPSGAQPLNNNTGYGVGIPVQAIKTEGCQTQYSPCPIDTYNSPQIRYSVDYQVENLRLRSRRSLSASRTVMSPDTDSLLALGPLSFSPLAFSNQNTYYSATDADFATLYDLPVEAPFNSSSLELYGGNGDDVNSPVFTKMTDPTGGTYGLLSLSDISNSELGYDNYLCAGVNSGLDQDWLVEPVSLPSPEEQDGDVTLTDVTPPAPPQTLSFQYSPSPVTPTSSLLTPDPSLPDSPSSLHSYSSEEEEIQDVLSFFDDGETNFDTTTAVQPFTPSVMLSAVSPSRLLEVDSPSPSCLSPSPSIQDSEDGCDSIGDVLNRRDSSASLPNLTLQTSALDESGCTGKSRKRKSLPISSSDKQSCAPSPAVKRRLTKAAKKDRKREQNKTAALRYRQKKKDEKSDIETRRAELEEKNEKLKAQVNSLSNEINYLKKLWSEVCRNKKESKLC